MRVAIVGYGRMGHEVEQALRARDHEVAVIVDPVVAGSSAGADGSTGTGARGSAPRVEPHVDPGMLAGCDVAIEFSLGDGVVANVRAYAEAGVPAVIGTTGWLERLDEVREIVGTKIGLVYGSNFSVGAHLFFRTAAYAASLVSELNEYDLFIHEVHHRGKKDSPSGTALTLAEAVMREVPRKSRIETGRYDRAPEPEELHVSSTRGGSVPGTHTLSLDSAADTIDVEHRARSRGGFALGAVRAAEWVADRKGLYAVDTFIDELFKGK